MQQGLGWISAHRDCRIYVALNRVIILAISRVSVRNRLLAWMGLVAALGKRVQHGRDGGLDSVSLSRMGAYEDGNRG